MGFFSALNDLLDEDSDNSLENRLTKGIDGIEKMLNTTLDKTENSIKRIDNATTKLEDITDKTEKAINRIDDFSRKKT